MVNMDVRRVAGVAIIHPIGAMDDAPDVLADVLVLVSDEDHLVFDLRDLPSNPSASTLQLCQMIRDRADSSEVVVVVSDPALRLQLVLRDVDRVVPMVESLDHALAVIEARCGSLRNDGHVVAL